MNWTGMTNGFCRIAAIVCCVVAARMTRAATHNWTGNANGNWSVAGNWDANGVPPSDGTADVAFSNTTAAVIATVDSAWASAGSVNSLVFTNTGKAVTLAAGSGVTSLGIGAGGVSDFFANNWAGKVFNIGIRLLASQKWFLDEGGGYDNQTVNFTSSDLFSAPGVTWTLGGRTRCQFLSGSSTGFLGQVTLNGYAWLDSVGQFGRFGLNPITVDNSNNLMGPGSVGATKLVFRPLSVGNTIMGNAFNLQLANTANAFYLSLGRNDYSTESGTGTTVEFTNSWSGTMVGGGPSNGGHVRPTTSPSVWDDRFQFKFSGDSSALLGPVNGAVSQSLLINQGIVVLNHPNAWGMTNSLAILVGNWNGNVPGRVAGLLASAGNTVNAYIVAQNNDQGNPSTNNLNQVVVLGLSGTGTVTFTGTLLLPTRNDVRYMQPIVRLTAPSNGTARFTGTMRAGYAPDAFHANLQVSGLGDVVLGGTNLASSVFKGELSIRSGRLLLATPGVLPASTGAILLGDRVSLPEGGAVRVATTLPLSYSSWSKLGEGTFTFSAAPNVDGIVPVLGDRVLVKDESIAGRFVAAHGIYVVSAADGKTWTRATDFNATNQYVYGLRVTVNSGTVNGGKAFFLINRQNVNGTAFTVGNATNLAFNTEAAVNPNVALLTAAAVSATNAILVTANCSSGTATLGGDSAHASSFSGPVSLQRGTQFAAASGGTVTFSGTISGTGSVVKVGAGVVRLTNVANNYSGGTSIRASVDDLTAGGRLEVSGALDLSGAADTLTIIGTPDRNTTYTLATYGTLNGEFDTVTPLAKHTVVYNGPGNTILLKPFPSGSLLLVR